MNNQQITTATVVGDCHACGGQMYDYEATQTDNGKMVHRGCMVECFCCDKSAPKTDMIYDNMSGKHFCDTNGDRNLQNSECWQAFQATSALLPNIHENNLITA